MFETLVASVIILLICFALLCINIIIKKNGKFPHTCVGGNKALQEKGIKCVQTQDFEANFQMNFFERMSQEG